MDVLAPLGRFFFAAMFLISGLGHFANGEAMIGYARGAGLPLATFGVYASGALLVVGGLCVLLGVFTRVAGAALALFLVTAAFVFHDFWTLSGQEAQTQRVHFLKNLSMMGGALLLVYFGPGPYSVRARSRVLAERRRERRPPGGPLRPQPQG
jgi:putative oxidoreductase